jgi:hypothetical protein
MDIINIDLEFIVKYKDIEEELIEKLDNNIDLGYTKDDVYQICEELYKHEILLFFKVDTIENKKVHHIYSDIWKKIQSYPTFMKVIEKYKEKMSQMDIEQTFILMFNYSLFTYIYPCIVSMYKQDMFLLEELLKKLEEKL